jgi:hypothetical protein
VEKKKRRPNLNGYNRKQPKNDLVYLLSCKWCTRDFLAARPDAKYHTQACRSAASRARRAAALWEKHLARAREENHEARTRAAELLGG